MVSPLSALAGVRHFALDMDGTLYRGGTLFPATLPFLEALRQRGIGYTFLTNNTSRSRKDTVRHLRAMGIPATLEQVHTPILATLHHLRECHPGARRLCLLGTPSFAAELEEGGYTITTGEPDVVIVAFDSTLTYATLSRAAWWISQGRPYLATHPDRVCPTDEPTVLPDCGALCAALRASTGREPDATLGKPNPAMLQPLLAEHRLPPSALAMVGDRIYTDMAMARQAGAVGILVLTGEATASDVADDPPLWLVLPGLATLLPYFTAQ